MDIKLDGVYRKKGFFEIIKRKVGYILKDSMWISVFFAISLQSILFIGILNSVGGATIKLNFSQLAFGDTYIYFLFAIILISITFLWSGRSHLVSLLIINILYSVLLIGDLWYYRGFNDFLSLHTLGETQNLNNLSRAVFAMSRPIDVIFVIIDLVVIVEALIMFKRYRLHKRERGVFAAVFFVPVMIILSLHLMWDYHDEHYSGHILFKTQYIPSCTMNNLTPIGYHFYDTIAYIKDNMPYKLNSSEENKIKEWLNYKNEDLPDNQYKSMFKGKNLIFIQVESLENFVINQKYNGQTLTPNLNSMLKNSLYFSNFYDQVNNGNSSDADLMANASVLPVRRGSSFFRFPSNQYNTIGKLLRDENYYTRSLHASDGSIWNVSKAIKNFGFNQSWDMHDFDQSDIYWMGLTDKSFFNQVSNLMDKDSKPFYYYSVTVSSHVPFVLADKMKTLNMDPNFDKTHMGSYLQSIHYADAQIGNFIKELDTKGILDNTLVVIYGDHCGVHKYYNDSVSTAKEHEAWWDDNGKIPFIIYNKSLQGKEITTAGGEIDIMPTVAYLMGLDKSKYENTTMGRNLLNTNKSYAILNDGTIIGKDKLSQEDINHIKESFDISDLITRTDYFKQNK